MANRYLPAEIRFWAKVDKTDGCWLWIGSRWASGYGQFSLAGCRRLAHRVAYELSVGAIPDDFTIDHLCMNKGCVNPEHLEVVSRGENVRRWAATITECPHGHAYTPENTRLRRGKRNCLTCQRERTRRVRAEVSR